MRTFLFPQSNHAGLLQACDALAEPPTGHGIPITSFETSDAFVDSTDDSIVVFNEAGDPVVIVEP